MKNLSKIIFFVILLPCFGFSQIKRSPVMLGMGGAYTTQADGIYAVGVNPANLNYQHGKPFMWQIGTLNFGLINNFLSLENTLGLSGENLETNNQRGKNKIYDQIRDGLRFNQHAHISIPMLSFSSGNMAVTNDIIEISDLNMPRGIFQFILEGNEVGVPIDLEFQRESMVVSEHSFSFAVPLENFSWGVTMKYLGGIIYSGTDPDSSFAVFNTDPTNFNLQAKYFYRQGIGGNGFAFDFGLATKELNGFRIGASIINAFGSINWNEPSLFGEEFSQTLAKLTPGILEHGGSWGPYVFEKNQALVHEIIADSVTLLDLTSGKWDETFIEKKYTISDLDDNGNARTFKVRYPGHFRLGISKQIDKDLLISSDLIAGFTNRLGMYQNWQLSAGIQFNRLKSIPLRVGYMYGGKYIKELGFGAGFHAGPVIYDFAFSFRNGVWVHNMKGISISLGIALTSFKSRKDKVKDSEK